MLSFQQAKERIGFTIPTKRVDFWPMYMVLATIITQNPTVMALDST